MGIKNIILASNNKDLIKSLSAMLNVKPFDCSLSLFEHILVHKPDFLILDACFQESINLNTIAKYITVHPGLMVIYLATDESESQRIALLQTGVNRILCQPISPLEIAANLRALSKLSLFENKAKLEVPLPVDRLPWTLIKKNWQLIAPNNQAASLTAREYYFLRCLFEQPGELVNKTYLTEKVIGLGVYSAHEKLNKVITLLKKKIVHELAIQLPIKTVHTLGYAFHADVALVD